MDTNVIAAALRSRTGASRRWLGRVLDGRDRLLLSVPLVLQYEDVLARTEILEAINLTGREVGELLDALCAICEPIEISFLWRPMLRDPDDEMVLELAVQGRADVLLTFNMRDFAGAERLGVSVMTPGEALRLRGKDQ